MSEDVNQTKGSTAEWLIPLAAVATVFVMLVPVRHLFSISFSQRA